MKPDEKDDDNLKSLYRDESEPPSSVDEGADDERDQLGGDDLYKDEGQKEPKGPLGKLRQRSKIRRNLILGSGLAGIILSIFGLITFLAPFKTTHIIESIESRVGNVPEYAVERRLEFYVSRYLIMRSMENSGIDIKTDRRFTYMGEGAMGTFYTNWRGSKMDAQLVEKGIKVTPINKDLGIGSRYTLPTNWRFEINGQPVDGGDGTLKSREARRMLHNLADENIEYKHIFQRYHHRRVLRKYFGIQRWKPFENKRNDARDKYFEAKKSFREYIARNMNRLNPRIGTWMKCMTDGDPAGCREKLRESRASSGTGAADADVNQADNIVDETLDAAAREGADEAADEVVARAVGSRIQEIGVKRILISGVAGIGILQFASNTEKAINDGTLSQIQYDRMMQQSILFTTPFLSGADQLRSGDDVNATHSRVMSDILAGGTKSPAYQGLFKPLAAGQQIRRDCNDNGNKTDPEDLLPPGETVCPQYKFVQNRTEFTNSPAWQTLHTFFEAYRRAGGDALTAATQKIFDTILIEPVQNAISSLLELTKVTQISAAALSSALNTMFGVGFTGMEQDEKAVDAIIAGISGRNSAVGGSVGKNREDTIGGAYLSNAQVTAIKDDMHNQRRQELRQQNFFARYFSPNTPESFTSQAIIAAPSSMQNVGNSLLNFINPSNLLNKLGSVSTSRARAASVANPFGVLHMGYTTDSEVFDMEPAELAEKYACNLPPDQRPQNKALGRPDNLPFDVYTQPDPCWLEQSVLDAGTRYLNQTYDEGIDGAGPVRSASAAANNRIFVLGDSYSVGMRQFGDLETKLTGWETKIDAACGRPLAGTGEFSACSQPPASQGLAAIDQNRDAITNAGTVIVGLGTNDLADNPEAFRANVKAAIQKIKGFNNSTRIYWVNLYVNDGNKAKAVNFNKVLSEEAAAGDFTVIDWAGKASAFYDSGAVHPREYQPLVDLIINSIGQPPKKTGLKLKPSRNLLDNFANLPPIRWLRTSL